MLVVLLWMDLSQGQVGGADYMVLAKSVPVCCGKEDILEPPWRATEGRLIDTGLKKSTGAGPAVRNLDGLFWSCAGTCWVPHVCLYLGLVGKQWGGRWKKEIMTTSSFVFGGLLKIPASLAQ